MVRFLVSFALLSLIAAPGPAQVGNGDPVKQKLELVKKKFDEAAHQFPKEVDDWFEKEDSRIRGLSEGVEPLLEKLKQEKNAFAKDGVLPDGLPTSLRQEHADSITEMTAYDTAILEYRKMRKDDDAETTKREKQEFLLYSAGPKERAAIRVVGRWSWNGGEVMVFDESGDVTQIRPNGQLMTKGRWVAQDDGKIAFDLDSGWKITEEFQDKDKLQAINIGPQGQRETTESVRLTK